MTVEFYDEFHRALRKSNVRRELAERQRLREAADPHGVTRNVMTPETMRDVPNTPGTPRRTIRVPDELWNAAQAKAEEQGTDVSTVIRKALERFVKRR